MTLRRRHAAAAALTAATALALLSVAGPASAAPGDSGFLGDAEPFSVLAYSTVTNSGADTLLDRSLGLTPGTDTPGIIAGNVAGSIEIANAVAGDAQAAADVAATDLMAVGSYDVGASELGGSTYVAGSYSSATSLLATGVITLQGDEDDVFIFTGVSDLTFAGSASLDFIGGAQPCNVFWRLGSSADIGTDAPFVGTLIAYSSISVGTRATVDGRLFAQNEAVTLLDNRFVSSDCDAGGDGSTFGLAGPGVVAPVPTVVDAPPAGEDDGDDDGTDDGGTDGTDDGTDDGGTDDGTDTELLLLPETGVDSWRPAGVAVLAVLVGLVLVSASSLRRRTVTARG